MDEYKFLIRILSQKYLSAEQCVMSEQKEKKAKPVKINKGKVSEYKVYNFDSEKKGTFLPYFSKSDGAPKLLNKFCDYVIVATFKNKTFILLVELKSGDTGTAMQQLNLSKIFIQYVINLAEGIAEYNSTNFNQGNVKIQKIVLKNRSNINRPTINPKNNRQDWNEDIWYNVSQDAFYLDYLCSNVS